MLATAGVAPAQVVASDSMTAEANQSVAVAASAAYLAAAFEAAFLDGSLRSRWVKLETMESPVGHSVHWSKTSVPWEQADPAPLAGKRNGLPGVAASKHDIHDSPPRPKCATSQRQVGDEVPSSIAFGYGALQWCEDGREGQSPLCLGRAVQKPGVPHKVR